MALSIRNERAEKLAREMAMESGENLTQAVIRSLEERLGDYGEGEPPQTQPLRSWKLPDDADPFRI